MTAKLSRSTSSPEPVVTIPLSPTFSLHNPDFKDVSAGTDVGPAGPNSIAVAAPSSNPVYTPDTSDNPSLSQNALPSNTSLPAQHPLSTLPPPPPPPPPPAPQQQHLSRSTAAASTQPTTQGAESRRRTAQIIGGRRRDRSEDDEEDGTEAGSASSVGDASSRRNAKRRRGESMLAEADGQETSNGAPRGVSNGSSHAGEGGGPPESSTRPHKAASESTNGLSQNGKAPGHTLPPTYLGHSREEVTRILIQALSDMGYHGAAESVSRDSGYELESNTVSAFRTAVLDGSWARAEELLDGAAAAGGQQTGNGLVLAPGADQNIMRVWLRQQKFLELLERRDTSRALLVLRGELTPLCSGQHQKLHFLSSLLMCQSTDDLKAKADWDGAHGQSRHILLSNLSSSFPVNNHCPYL